MYIFDPYYQLQYHSKLSYHSRLLHSSFVTPAFKRVVTGQYRYEIYAAVEKDASVRQF